MAAKKNLAELAKVIADHQANLSRLGEAWGQVVADALDDTDRKLIARLEDLVADVQANYRRNTAKAVNQLEYIRTKIEEIRIRAFVKAEKELRKTVPDLIENETKWSKKLLSELTGESKAKFADITSGQAEKLLKNSIQINKTWDQWWTNTAAGDVMRIADVINAGVVQGLTIPQMTRLIRGTKEGNFTDGVLSTSRRHARNMARTLCAGISNQAKDQFYRDNQDIIPQVEWLDTLDGRTCPSCAGLSRRRYDTDKPHPVPPIHPSCRCVLLPVTELTDLGEDVPRPAANADFDAEAKRMYEEKYPNKNFDDLAPSTREQYRHKAIHEYEERTGKPAFTRAPGSMKFADYFQTMSEQQKKDWLGRGKYAEYKAGKPIDAFIPPFPNKAFTVKRLKEMDIDSFKARAKAEARSGATNRFGEEIVFHEKHTPQTRGIITALSQQYDTRLKTVNFGAEGAGDVDMSCTTMRLSAKKPQAVIHEFAHTISNSDGAKYGLFDEKDKAFWKEMRKLQLKYLREVGQDSKRWISSYEHGSRDVQEFFAEAFTQVKLKELGFDLPLDYGNDFTYSNEAMKILEKYFKRKK